ncbi:MAG: stealth family protein [bacterium]
MKIDLVYLWCDGNDPIWRAKRQEYLNKVDTTSDLQTFCEGRFADNNDLLYSLRSVDMYAPWINHIYIVTDNQCPEWLDTTNNRITIVDHSELFKKDQLPLYNSVAIELGIHKIKGLSEHYLYANDDMMFNRAVSPQFFFTRKGKVKCRFFPAIDNIDVSGTYGTTILSANKIISSDFGLDVEEIHPYHQIDAYVKSSVENSFERYKTWAEATIRNKFRSPNDMQRHVFSLYAIVTGDGVMIKCNDSKIKKLLRFIAMYLKLSGGFDSKVFDLKYTKIEQCLSTFKPALVCFNDTEIVQDADRLRMKELYSRLYPSKSQFEK